VPGSRVLDPHDEPGGLDGLDATARRAQPRVRVAVGAAVTLFIAAVAVAALLSFGAGGGGEQPLIDGSAAADSLQDDGGAPEQVTVGAAPLLVHVLGAVAKPGLVELAAGARVVDAVAAAGGFTADADPAGVNLARPVVDGEQLVVLAVGQVPPPTAPGQASGEGGAAIATDGKVHLNTADVAALDTLPRIGPALAQRIIDWREANGPFTSVDQLLEVTGIGDAVFGGLADRVAL
jgi:competence protein ComEA